MARVKPIFAQIALRDSRSGSRRIFDSILLKIRKWELKGGARFPSVRGLAQQLSLDPNAKAMAYAELRSKVRQEAWPRPGLIDICRARALAARE